MAHKTLYLIRHGQYNPEVKIEPLGGSLTETGIEQVTLLAALLSGIPLTAIFTSCLTRAVETAQLIAACHPGITITQIDNLKEITPPLPYLAFKFMKDTPIEEITRDRLNIEAVYDRLFKPANQNDEYEAVICHGNVIRYFTCRVLQIPLHTWLSMEIYNASVTGIEIDEFGNSILLSYNETTHLPEELKTQNMTPMGAGRKYSQTATPTPSSGELTHPPCNPG